MAGVRLVSRDTTAAVDRSRSLTLEPIDEYQLPFLGGDEVVEEVIALLAKLENDRQETLEALKVQRVKSKQLKLKINEHCKKRLCDLPRAVQAGKSAVCLSACLSVCLSVRLVASVP